MRVLAALALVLGGVFWSSSSHVLIASAIAPDLTRQTPLAASASDGADAWPLFDRSTLSAYPITGPVEVVAEFEAAREVGAIKIHGPAPAMLTVKADRGEGWETVEGLSGLDLRNLGPGWNRLDAALPVRTARLQFVFEPRQGGTQSTGVNEIEVWAKGAPRVTYTGRQLLMALGGDTPPAQARLYAASPQEAYLGRSGRDESAAADFSFSVPYAPARIKRAWLAYEVNGAAHWVSTVRRLNGGVAQGGSFRLAARAWSVQLEPVDPNALRAGANTLRFEALDEGSYAVRNLRLLVELDDGANFVDRVEADVDFETNPAAAVRDGDETTGWRPYPAGGVSEPRLALLFDKPTQTTALGLYLVNSLKGVMEVEALSGGEWKGVPTAVFNGGLLGAGWNVLSVPTAGPVDGLRLVFKSGEGSGAEFMEIVPLGSGTGHSHGPHISIAYPDRGQYYGDRAYIRGFAHPGDNGSGPVSLRIAGKHLSTERGEFETTLTKAEAGFGLDPEDKPWSVTVEASYPDGQKITRVIHFNAWSDASLAAQRLVVPRAGLANPGTAAIPYNAYLLEHERGLLELDPEALDGSPDEITITALSGDDLPPLPPGMTNVTAGPHKGYRFLPHGKKFKKKVRLTLPYDAAKLPPGMSEEDIKTYYFDTEIGRWLPLERKEVNKNKRIVVNYTDHFTDMINATVTVPEHPQAASFNATQIRDIKAADPGAGINLIEPPQANNNGDARLTYPLELPAGRSGMQPQLAISYTSGGGNGWLGVGWDMNVPSISVDTRWGVPRYDTGKVENGVVVTPAYETETYLLNGEMLTPVAHRGELRERDQGTELDGNNEPVKIFHSRVEGKFHKIIRHGNAPDNYWWEVIEKAGVRHLYGGINADDRSGTLGGDKGIFKWMLRKSIDPHGNTVTYEYTKVCDSGIGTGHNADGDSACDADANAVPGYQIYIDKIRYTGHDNDAGPYTVKFKRQAKRRPDVIIDGRGRFKQVTAHRLHQVVVKYKNEFVRTYELKYREGKFHKSLLKRLIQKTAPTDTVAFNEHAFDYYDELPLATDGYDAFYGSTNWNAGSDSPDLKLGGLIEADASILGGDHGRSKGDSSFYGMGWMGKINSVGVSMGGNTTNSNGLMTLMDIDGDGLPDKVFRNGGVSYEKNPWTPGADPTTGKTFLRNNGAAFSASSLSQIAQSTSISSSRGVQAYYGGGNVYYEEGSTTTTEKAYFSDVNGDGLPDAITPSGMVLFGSRAADGSITYTADSQSTEVSINDSGSAAAVGSMLPDMQAERERLAAEYPLLDAVRRWKAPFPGTIEIRGAFSLKDTSAQREAEEYETADGVRVAIEKEAANGSSRAVLWAKRIPIAREGELIDPRVEADDEGRTLSAVSIAKGDNIFFRVQSRGDDNEAGDGAYDEVLWQPEIVYLGKAAYADVNNLNAYRYNAKDDFVVVGRRAEIPAPFRGLLKIDGTLHKAVTTDDVTLVVERIRRTFNSSNVMTSETRTRVIERTLPWHATEPVSLADIAAFPVERDDSIEIRFKVDSAIDATAVRWEKPRLYYTEAYSASETLYPGYDTSDAPATAPNSLAQPKNADAFTPATDSDGSVIELPAVALSTEDADGNPIYRLPLTYDMDLYPENSLTSARQPWPAPQKGVLLITPWVSIKQTAGDCGFFDSSCPPQTVAIPDGDVHFTVKRRGELLGKKTIRIRDRVAGLENGYHGLIIVPVESGEELFFDFSVPDPQVADKLELTAVKLHYGSETAWKVPVTDTASIYAKTHFSIYSDGSEDPSQERQTRWFVARRGTEILHQGPMTNTVGTSELRFDLPVTEDEELYFDIFAAGSGTFSGSEVRATYTGAGSWIPPQNGIVSLLPQLTYKDGFAPNATVHLKAYQNGPDVERTFAVVDGSVVEDPANPLLLGVQAGNEVLLENWMQYWASHGLTDKSRVRLKYMGNVGWTVPSTWGSGAELLTLAVSPQISLKPGSTADGSVEFTVHHGSTVLASAAYTITAGQIVPPANLPLDVQARRGDDLKFFFTASNPAVGAALATHTVKVAFGGSEVVAASNFAFTEERPATWLQIHLPVKEGTQASKPSVRHWGEVANAFPARYRGWAVIGINGNGTRETAAINSADLVLKQTQADYQRNSEILVYPAYPDLEEEDGAPLRWVSQDSDWAITADGMIASRKQVNYVDFVKAEDYATMSGAVRPPRMSWASTISWGGGYWLTYNQSNSDPGKGLLDLVDLNGDRFPDLVNANGARFTRPDGSFDPEATPLALGDGIRKSKDESHTVSVGPAPGESRQDEKGEGEQPPPEPPSVRFTPAFTGSVGGGGNEGISDLVDVNGDGLPDRVTRNGNNLMVALSLGYEFAEPESWGEARISETESDIVSGGASLGVSTSWSTVDASFSGGISLGYTENTSGSGLFDVNGDGWADYIHVGAFNSDYPGVLLVALNQGGRFAPLKPWRGALTHRTQQGRSLNAGLNASATVVIPIPIVNIGIIVTKGKSWSESISRPEVRFIDINGDGYVDSIASDRENTLQVALSKGGKTNLLRSVKRPLGAEFTLDYEPTGNTYEHPQMQWVLSKVTLFDGVAGDTPASDAAEGLGSDYQLTTFAYEDGYHNRFEREFLGFAKVTQTQYDTAGLDGDALAGATRYREIVQEYGNRTVYERGLLTRQTTFDVRPDVGRVKKLVTVNSYRFRDVATNTEFPKEAAESLAAAAQNGAPVFPQLTRTTRRFFEEGGSRATFSTYDYDVYGNITLFHDAGDSDVDDDDVWASITYTGTGASRHPACAQNYIVGKPEAIHVQASRKASDWLRRREADFDCATGAATAIRAYLDDNRFAETKLVYNRFGNLKRVKGPLNVHRERLILEFEYDRNATNTYVTRVDNLSYGYASTADYDPKWGQLLFTTDINGQTISYTYDGYGRLETVHGPKEGAGTATIRFAYTPYTDLKTAPFASWARTEHFDADTGNTGTIDTLLFTDGLKRVLQTKKDASVDGEEVMIVSGRASLDAFGRAIRQYYPTTEAKGANTDLNLAVHDAAPPTRTSYDILDRVLETVTPDGATTTLSYGLGTDAHGRERFKTTVQDAEGKQTISFRDTRELITTVQEKYGSELLSTRYGYDRLKQIDEVMDAAGNVTTVDYDALGRRTAIDNPDTGRVSYDYDLAGNLIEKITPNLRAQGSDVAIRYDYDHTRLVAIYYPNNPDNDVHYEYGTGADAALGQVGRIKKVQHGGGVEAREYGPLGEITKETKTLAQGPSYRIFVTGYDHDSFGRLLTLTLPDGEVLSHHYDAGGNLERITGTKQGSTTTYLESLTYDAFEQRRTLTLGNGIQTRYSYDPLSRRLCRLQSGPDLAGSDSCAAVGNARGEALKSTLASLAPAPRGQFQNLHYAYDRVGNILGLGNAVQVPRQNELGGPAVQIYAYDDLHRLTDASGIYHESDRLRHEYDLALGYDTIHNITHKKQTALQYNGDKAREEVAITYDWAYAYKPSGFNAERPHAPIHIGQRSFHYDDNGNQTGWEHDANGTRRDITWDEENRIQAIRDPGNTLSFLYDDQGQRTRKKGQHGEVVYVNQYYTLKNGAITSKHVFAGTSRIVSRVITAEQAPRTREPGLISDSGGEAIATVETDSGTLIRSDAANDSVFARPVAKEPNPGQARKDTAAPATAAASTPPAGEAQPGSHPGQGIYRRSERANEVAQNTNKNPNLSGGFPGQGLEHRSDSANQHARNTEQNPHLNGTGTGGGGAGGGNSGGNSGGNNSGGNSGGGNSGNNGGGNGGGNSGTPNDGLQGADFLYYYHPDHLGSTGYVTDAKGQLYEHLQYFPFGETWVEQSSNIWRTPYLYTSKELDPETGLYYYGARYYDPRTSVWQSADPIIGVYLGSDETKLRNQGVFNPINLAVYSYGANSPIVILDPDGNANLRFSENVSPEERAQVTSNLQAVEARVTNQSTGDSQVRLLEAFEKWDVNYVGGGPRAGKITGKTEGRAGKSEIYVGDQDTLAHEFYHTVPENINRGNYGGLVGNPESDPSEHGEFGAYDFSRDLLSGENVDKYSRGETARPLPVERPRRGFFQYLKETYFSSDNDR